MERRSETSRRRKAREKNMINQKTNSARFHSVTNGRLTATSTPASPWHLKREEYASAVGILSLDALVDCEQSMIGMRVVGRECAAITDETMDARSRTMNRPAASAEEC